MKECAFTPTAEEAAAIQAAMDHRHITRVSEYVRMAVMQVVRRELAAKNKKLSKVDSEIMAAFKKMMPDNFPAIERGSVEFDRKFETSPSAT